MHVSITTTEYAFIAGHLSRLPLGLRQKVAFVPGPKASRASGGTGAFCPGWSHQPGQKAPLLSRLVAPPGTKGPTPFIPVGNTNPDKRVTLLSRLVVPTWTKGPST